MSYYNINSSGAVGYCGQGATETETKEMIQSYAKEKAELAKEFLLRFTDDDIAELEHELKKLKSTTEIDIYFRRFIKANI